MHSAPTTAFPRLRRLRLLAGLPVLALAAAPALVACDDDDNGDGLGPTPTIDGSTPNGTTPTPGGPPANGTPDGDGGVPDNAEDYAEATFDAWSEDDTDTLAVLADDEALIALQDRPYDEDDAWTAIGCSAGAGSVACTWESVTGDTLELLLENAAASAGEPQAVVEARFS